MPCTASYRNQRIIIENRTNENSAHEEIMCSALHIQHCAAGHLTFTTYHPLGVYYPLLPLLHIRCTDISSFHSLLLSSLGTITGLRNYGAFLELDGGMAGLLHISQISYERVDSLETLFTIGQRCKVCHTSCNAS